MKNTLQDLNNHLFEQLERLNDEELTDEELDRELKRAEGMTKIATQIIENGELAFKTMVHMDEYGYNNGHQQVPVMLEARTQTGGLSKGGTDDQDHDPDRRADRRLHGRDPADAGADQPLHEGVLEG